MSQKKGTAKKTAAKGMSLWGLAMRRFVRNRLAMLGAIVLVIILLFSIVGPFFSPYGINDIDAKKVNKAPSTEHWLGTDELGRDQLTRLMVGGRYSLMVGVCAEIVVVLIGTVLGISSGYFGKWVDNLIMRLTDILMCLPYLPILIVLSAVLSDMKVHPKYRIYIVMFIIGILGWTGLCRMVRGEVLSLREQEFMMAADTLGLSDSHKMFRHLLPNTLAPIIVSATLGIGGAILAESSLSFLGLGIVPPTPSWGQLLQAARNTVVLQKRLWLWAPPGFMILMTVLSINLIGDGLRDAFDPKMRN